MSSAALPGGAATPVDADAGAVPLLVEKRLVQWHLAAFVFFLVTSMCFNLLSDGLRSAMDTRLKA